MAWPYIVESTFELGTNAEWTSEADTGSLLDFPHYSVLAGIPGIGPAAPYRGAYCMRIVAGDANIHALTNTSLDVAVGDTRWVSFQFYVSPDFTATADDTFNIFEFQSAGDVVERAIGCRITAATDAVEIGVGKVAPTVFASQALTKGKWHHVELQIVSNAGAGTSALWVDGTSVASIDTLTDLTITEGQLGTSNTLSTTTGTLLFDMFKFDDGQVFQPKYRYPVTVPITADQHIFIGPGWIESAEILSASGTLYLYDTDAANTSNEFEGRVVDLDTTQGRPGFSGGAYFRRGCFADLSASGRAEIKLSTGEGEMRGRLGPLAHWSPGAIRSYGVKRKAPTQNV